MAEVIKKVVKVSNKDARYYLWRRLYERHPHFRCYLPLLWQESKQLIITKACKLSLWYVFLFLTAGDYLSNSKEQVEASQGWNLLGMCSRWLYIVLLVPTASNFPSWPVTHHPDSRTSACGGSTISYFCSIFLAYSFALRNLMSISFSALNTCKSLCT